MSGSASASTCALQPKRPNTIRHKREIPPQTGHHMLAITENIIDASARRPTIGIVTRRVGDPLLSPLALQRWESEGGAVPAPRSQAQRLRTRASHPKLLVEPEGLTRDAFE